MASNSPPPDDARARYLSGLTPEQQVEVLLKAERLGPAPNDEADWLVAQAAASAAAQIAASSSDAAARIEAALGQGDIVAQLERIESHLKMAAEPTVSGPMRDLYDRVMALCPSDAARLELSRLGAELNLGASSAEWVMVILYAESRGIFGTATETDRTDIRAQLDRIEAQMGASLAKMPSLTDICGQLERIETRMAAPPAKVSSPIMIVSPRMRDLLLFTSTVLLCVAFAAAFGAAAAPFVVVIAAFAVGLCTTIAYCWLAPMFSSEK